MLAQTPAMDMALPTEPVLNNYFPDYTNNLEDCNQLVQFGTLS